jgi:cysteine desulfurase
MHKIYLDNAATSPIEKEVISVMTQSLTDNFGNPSSSHQFGRRARAMIERSRKKIAHYLKCSSSEIIFTAGGSEADNLILFSAVKNLKVKRIIISKIEHHAVLHTAQYLEKDFSIKIDFVDVTNRGEIDFVHLKSLLEDSSLKTLVSLMHVNNEIGNILDIDKVVDLCQKNNALFHSDTVQGIAHVNFDLQNTPIDFIAASAHKFHGPKGVGFAVFKKGFGISPILYGGEQERGARAGTENTHSIIGMEKALTLAMEYFERDKDYISDLKQYFVEQLQNNFQNIEFNGFSADPEKSAFHILNVRFDKDVPMLLFNLDLKGIAASGGSACQSGSNQGSHVLNTILSENESMNTSIRFSFNKHNTKEEINYVITVLKDLIP